MIESLHDWLNEYLITKKLAKEKSYSENCFPESSNVSHQVINVLNSSFVNCVLVILPEVHTQIRIIVRTISQYLEIFLHIRDWVEVQSLFRCKKQTVLEITLLSLKEYIHGFWIRWKERWVCFVRNSWEDRIPNVRGVEHGVGVENAYSCLL